MKIENNLYFIVSIIMGGILMGMEVIVSKLIGPYFGASLYVWAAVIGTTLIGLASGYYLSGILIEKKSDKLEKLLFQISLVTLVYVLILPNYSSLIMNLFMNQEVRLGIIVSTILFNLPLYILLGLYSPIIIQIIDKNVGKTGWSSGIIYGVSTLSGVVFLIIVGVYLLINFTAIQTVYLLSILVAITTVLQYLKLKKIEK